jgi:uncharacterized membrane protein HdeD (DUF308 family)
MTTSNPNLGEVQGSVRQAVHDHWVLFLIQGAVMAVLGLFAMAVPVVATLAVDIYAGWLFLISGIVGLVTLFRVRNVPSFLWTLIAAALAIVVGILLIGRPVLGTLSLTMLLTAFFIAEGVTQILAAVKNRGVLATSWVWMLLSGIVDLVLAAILIKGWPGTAAWALGLIVGINLFMSGLGLVMTAIASRALTGPSAATAKAT